MSIYVVGTYKAVIEGIDDLGERGFIETTIHGVVRASDVTDWLGVPPAPAGVAWVNLQGPEPVEREPSRWLVFDEVCAWTSDLVAVRVSVPEDA